MLPPPWASWLSENEGIFQAPSLAGIGFTRRSRCLGLRLTICPSRRDAGGPLEGGVPLERMRKPFSSRRQKMPWVMPGGARALAVPFSTVARMRCHSSEGSQRPL